MKLRENILKNIIDNKSVLDLGCNWGGDFHTFIQNNSVSVKGCDIEAGHDFQADLNNPVDLGETFDVIVAGELIEHIANTKTFLENVQKHMGKNGTFFLTTPNPTSFRFYLYAFLGKEPEFGGHIKYFTKDALDLLLNQFFDDVQIGPTNNLTNQGNKHKISWRIKFFIENIMGTINSRFAPHYYAICRSSKK